MATGSSLENDMRSDTSIRLAEHWRIDFLLTTRGYVEAKLFARQTIDAYKKALATPYGKSYRRELIISLVELRWFVRNC